MIRILFISDTHLGLDLPFRPRIQRRRRGDDFFANYHRALKPAANGEVDCVVHGGDLLYRSKVPPHLVALAAEPLKKVAEAGVPVYLVPGNHERSVIPHFERLHHPKIFVFDRPRTFVLDAGGMRLALAGFPFFRGAIRNAFGQLLATTQWQRQSSDAVVLCIHQSVDGARVGPQNYMFRDKPDVLDAAAIPSDFTAVLAGHIHRFQVLTENLSGQRIPAPVFFPGSIERTSLAEKDEKKGYLTLDIVRGESGEGRLNHWQFHQLPVRPMIRLDLQLNQMKAEDVTAWVAEKISVLPADAIVQLRLSGTPGKSVSEVIRAEALRRLAPDSMNIEAIFLGLRRSGQGWRKVHRNADRNLTPIGQRPSWQRQLFDVPPKRKTEP